MYECHLTYDGVNSSAENDLITIAATLGWKHSFINVDPELGLGQRLFLTCHSVDFSIIYNKMAAMVTASVPLSPVRQKIEHIIYDTKNNIGLPHNDK